MARFGRVLRQGVKDLWDEIGLSIGLSLLWWLAMITVVLSAPATVALADFGYRMARQQRVGLDEAKATLRQHFWMSWRLGLAALLGAVVIAGNIWFYAQMTGWLRILAVLFIYLALAWLAINVYALPMIGAMKAPSLRQIYRNAAIIAFANPVYSLLLVTVLAVMVAAGLIFPPLGLTVTPALIAIVSARALADRLDLAAEKTKQRVEPS